METRKKNNGLLFPEKPPRRHSYMLRCMEARGLQNNKNGSSGGWHFSLHDPKNGAVVNFEDLDALVSFLQRFFDLD